MGSANPEVQNKKIKFLPSFLMMGDGPVKHSKAYECNKRNCSKLSGSNVFKNSQRTKTRAERTLVLVRLERIEADVETVSFIILWE